MELEQRVKAVVADTLGLPVENITLETAAGEADGWDSVGHLNLISALEQTFGVHLAISDVESLTNVKQIVAHLQAKGISAQG